MESITFETGINTSFDAGEDLSFADDFSDVWSMVDKPQPKSQGKPPSSREHTKPTRPRPESVRSRCDFPQPPQRCASPQKLRDSSTHEKQKPRDSTGTKGTVETVGSSSHHGIPPRSPEYTSTRQQHFQVVPQQQQQHVPALEDVFPVETYEDEPNDAPLSSIKQFDSQVSEVTFGTYHVGIDGQ